MLQKCLILCIGYFVTSSQASLAPFIVPCTPQDSACMIKSAKIALPYFCKGVEELGIPPLEPLPIKDVNADTGDLKVAFRNTQINQISKCDFNEITRDPVKLTATVTVTCPLTITGDYTLGGKLFFLDIEGEDKYEIAGGTIRVSVNLKLKTFNDGEGKKHYKVGSFDYSYEPIKKYNINFKNLFHGDRAKAEPIEQVINESWKELILDIGKPVIKESITVIAHNIDKMFKLVPAEELEIV